MAQQIQDGAYLAHLAGAQVKLTSTNKLMIVFRWELAEGRGSINSYSVISQADGALNPKPIGYIQRWCPEWDGSDPYWFEEHLAELRALEVKVSIRNEPSYRDANAIIPVVSWVNPAKWTPTAKRTPPEVYDPDNLLGELKVLGDAPEFDLAVVEPTMSDVWGAYAYLCRKIPIAKRDACWIAKVRELVPGKDQIDFTHEDWGKVLAWMRA